MQQIERLHWGLAVVYCVERSSFIIVYMGREGSIDVQREGRGGGGSFSFWLILRPGESSTPVITCSVQCVSNTQIATTVVGHLGFTVVLVDSNTSIIN